MEFPAVPELLVRHSDYDDIIGTLLGCFYEFDTIFVSGIARIDPRVVYVTLGTIAIKLNVTYTTEAVFNNLNVTH